jgi:hypothetical protein
MTKLKPYAVFAVAALLFAGIVAFAQESVSSAFEKLQSSETTDAATQDLLKLATSNPSARQYLTTRLPLIIAAGPKGSYEQWANAVRLAGALRIDESSQALTQWITINSYSPITLSSEANLTSYPAAHALVLIGDPAIPALNQVLTSGDTNRRWKAAYALNLIGSRAAKLALRAQAAHEPDVTLARFITEAAAK